LSILSNNVLVLALFLSVLGTQFYKRRFEKEETKISHAQKLILDRMNDLGKKSKGITKRS
jgi:hypothetical protein